MLDEQIQRELQEFVKTPDYKESVMSLSASGTKEYVSSDEFAERIGSIVHESVHGTLSLYPLESFNGSDTSMVKVFPEAFRDLSWNVRKSIVQNELLTKGLEENTKITKTHSEALKGKMRWMQFKTSVSETVKLGEDTYHIRRRWKWLLALGIGIIGFFASPVTHKLLNLLLGFFGWKVEIQ